MKLRILFFCALLLGPAAAQAAPRDDVMAGAVRCAQITDDRAWLDCYYGAAQPMRAQLGLIPAPASQTGRVPLAPGATRLPQAPPKKDFLGRVFSGSSVKTRMESYKFDRDGRFTVSLSNGTVWEQITGDSNYAHWRDPAGSYNVSVAEGAFGHADLTVEKDGGTYQVRRVVK